MSAQILCGVVALFVHYQVVSSECGWDVEFTNWPNAFKYFSTCNKEQYLNVTMESLVEYSSILGRVSPVAFGLPPAQKYAWSGTTGMSSSYQGYEVNENHFAADLSDFLEFHEAATLNLSTYVFQEIGEVLMYNTTQLWMDKYFLKWELEISEWPWLEETDTLQLCLDFQTPNATYEVEGSYGWQNISYSNGFYFAFPSQFTCDDEIQYLDTGDIVAQPNSTILQLCLTFPHCAGDIFYDPLISSSYQGIEPKRETGKMSPVTIVGIVLTALLVGSIVLCLGIYCVQTGKSGGGGDYNQQLIDNEN